MSLSCAVKSSFWESEALDVKMNLIIFYDCSKLFWFIVFGFREAVRILWKPFHEVFLIVTRLILNSSRESFHYEFMFVLIFTLVILRTFPHRQIEILFVKFHRPRKNFQQPANGLLSSKIIKKSFPSEKKKKINWKQYILSIEKTSQLLPVIFT